MKSEVNYSILIVKFNSKVTIREPRNKIWKEEDEMQLPFLGKLKITFMNTLFKSEEVINRSWKIQMKYQKKYRLERE